MQSITKRLKNKVMAVLLALTVCMTSISVPISIQAAEPAAYGTELKPVALADLTLGNYYVLKYYKEFSDTPKGGGNYVISSKDASVFDSNTGTVTTETLSWVRDFVKFSETEFTADMVWKIEACEGGGYSLQSADTGKYLTVDSVEGVTDMLGLYMRDEAQALTLNQGSNGAYITKNVDEVVYSVRYTGGSGAKPGWVAGTSENTREFTLYEVVEASEPVPDVEFGLVKLEPGTDGLVTLEEGERYVFATSVSDKTYALSSDKTAYTEKDLLGYKEFDGSINTLTKDIVWFYGKYSTSKTTSPIIRSADNGRFLDITSSGIRAKFPTTGLEITSNATANGQVSFCESSKYYLTFTSEYNQGFYISETQSDASAFDVYKVVGTWPEEAAPQEFSLTWVHPDDKQIDDVYVFPLYKQMATGNPTENGVQTLTSNEVVYNDTRYGREAKTFEYDLNTLDRAMAFVLEPGEDGEGYALRSLATGEYLNLSTNNLKLGELQTLAMKTLSLQQVGIGDGAGNYVRFLSKNPRGWTSGTTTSNYEFDMFRVNGVWPEDRTSETFGTKWMRLKDMQVGDTLVFSSYESIVSTDKGEDVFALSAFDSGSNSKDLMEHVSFISTALTVDILPEGKEMTDLLTEDIAWVLEEGENGQGYALRSMYYDQYLNINVVNGQGSLSLGGKQTLQLTTDANNRIVISRNIDGTVYRVSFTNENGGGWQAGTTEEYSQFNAWRITGEWPEALDEAPEREKPLMTVAAVTDFHIGHGEENNDQVLGTNLDILNDIEREKVAPDVLLVGGDMTDNDSSTAWTQETFDKVKAQLTEALEGTADKVLYVTGDTDYEAGGSTYSSAAFIDSSMQADVGDYKSALYEDADRASNLLAYYYEIEGIHFVGLNTPYNGDGSISGYVYTPESIEWVVDTLESIGAEETIIFMSHYMLQDSKGTTSGQGIDNANGANDKLKEILLSYPNLLHVYGHDHGDYISESVFERVTAYETDGSIQLSDSVRAGGFTSAFMGSLSYSDNPQVVQALFIYVYADRIELEMKNYGSEKGDRMYPLTYSIPLLKPVASEVYTVTDAAVTDIAHGVTVGEFISNFTASDEIVVKDLQGTTITDMSRKLRNGMMVARISEGAVLDEKEIHINLAADDGYPYKIERVNLTGEAGVVYDIAEAQELTSVVISKQKEDAAAGILYVGIYAEDGSLLQAETKQVSESGTVDVNMSLANCLAGATYRIFMVDALDSMTLLSALETSNEEYYQLDGFVSKDASTELVACLGYVDKDTAKSSILVYDMNAADWNEEAALVWQWRPSAELGFLGAEKYIGASDAKLRYSEFYGGYVVVTCSTKGFVGIIDYETGENLYSRPSSPENNTHAVELLPDGNMVAASTTGNTVTIYTSSQGGGEGYYKQYSLTDAHGLLWDPELNVLWALGNQYLRAYKVTGTLEKPELEQVENYRLPNDGGHDLYAVYGTDNALWITTSEQVYQFNTRTKEFVTDYPGYSDFVSTESVKGIGNQPFSGTIITMIPNGALNTWNSDTIDLYYPEEDGSYTHEAKVHNANAFYKVRAWYPNYR